MIYLVRLHSGAIKIGYTDNSLNERLGTLSRHYGAKVALLATLPGGREEETELHLRFEHLRIGRKEQFRPEADLLEFIPNAGESQPAKEQNVETMQTNMRLDHETLKMMRSLAHHWGTIKPLTNTDVVRECVKRVHQAETATTTPKTPTAGLAPNRRRREG